MTHQKELVTDWGFGRKWGLYTLSDRERQYSIYLLGKNLYINEMLENTSN